MNYWLIINVILNYDRDVDVRDKMRATIEM